MRITVSQLRRIIKEEISKITEAAEGTTTTPVEKGEEFEAVLIVRSDNLRAPRGRIYRGKVKLDARGKKAFFPHKEYAKDMDRQFEGTYSVDGMDFTYRPVQVIWGEDLENYSHLKDLLGVPGVTSRQSSNPEGSKPQSSQSSTEKQKPSGADYDDADARFRRLHLARGQAPGR